MLCSICEGPISYEEDPHDAGHDRGCPRLDGDWSSSCWCDLAPAHSWCCDICKVGPHRSYPPLPPAPRATGLPGAFI